MLTINSLSKKLLVLVSIIIISTLIGIGLIFLYLKIFSNQPIALDELNLLTNKENAHLIKPILVINHLTTFVMSALLYNNFVAGPNENKYILVKKSFDVELFMKCILFVLCCYPLAGVITYFIEQLNLSKSMTGLSTDNANLVTQLVRANGFFDRLSSIIVIAIIPSIGEELLFRGVLQKILSEHLSIFIAIGLSSFIFAALHLDPIGFGFKFLIGVALGIIYHYSGNILFPISIHFLNNLIPLIVINFINVNEIKSKQNNLTDVLIIGLIFIPLGYLIYSKIKYHSHG